MSNSLILNKVIKYYEKLGILIILIIEIIIFATLSDKFFTSTNLMLVCRQVSFCGIAAVGMTMVLLVGEIDISGGSILAFSGCLSAMFVKGMDLPVVLALLLVLIISSVIGLATGYMVAYLAIPSLICTLAMQTIIKGVTYLTTGGVPIGGLPDGFKLLGQGFIFGAVPVPLLFMGGAFIIGYVVLNNTFIGRRIYSVGGNGEAARLSGIRTKKYVIGPFVVSAALAGLAGFLMAARLGTGQPSTGSDFAMDVLTATVLGGVLLTGGKGKIQNVLIGALIIGVLSNGLVMCRVSEYWQWVIKGLVFLFAVMMSNLERYFVKK